ncbi:MAG: hypothetical protein IJF00_05325 [Bacteroidaceae bacterium]|nr:hypothetical protein [Bacteroidaceae bacterium]
MNKKLFKTLLFGGLLITSTGAFVSCSEDYDDDIKDLQTQIDENSSAIDKSIAEKFAALEQQLSSLKNAEQNLQEELAAAKAEAATASEKALAAAQAAQSGADGAQATADAAVAELTKALARVATLETKLTNLEQTIAELTKANEELGNKLSEVQELVNSIKSSADVNTESIKELSAKYSELATAVSNTSATLGARIDAIDATLNTIKENYATNEELQSKAQELAEADAKLEAQIKANAALIAALEKEAKDANAELNEALNAAKSDISKINEELASIKAAFEQQIKAVEEKVAQAEANAKAYADKLAEELAKTVGENAQSIADNKKANEELAKTVADLIEQINSAHPTTDVIIGLINESLTDYLTSTEVEQMVNAAVEALQSQIDELESWKETFAAEYTEFVNKKNEELENINKELEKYGMAISTIDNQVQALINRLQSVVFVPQYNDAQGNVIVPTYNYYTSGVYTSEQHNATLSVRPTVELKFRVAPAEAATELVEMYEEDNSIMKLYVENALQTRAANAGIATITNVKSSSEEQGVIVVSAKVDRIENNQFRPTALVIGTTLYDNEETEGEEVSLNVTTEYFNLKGIDFISLINSSTVVPVGISKTNSGAYGIPYVDINVSHNPATESKSVINNLDVNVTNWNYDTKLKLYAGYADDNKNALCKVSDNTTANRKWSDFTNYAKTKGFLFEGSTFKADKTSAGAAIVANVGNTITLILADETFGYDYNGEPYVTYEVTYELTNPTDSQPYELGTYTRVWDTTDGSNAFTVSSVAGSERTFSKGSQTIVPFEIADSKNNRVMAADANTLATELNSQIAAGNVTYTINDDENVSYVTLTVDVNTLKADLNVNFPAATKYEDKTIKAVVSTIYGNVTFVATAKLSYPTDFLVHEERFTNGKFNVEAGNQVLSYRDGKMGSSLSLAYVNYKKYELPNVQYIFESVQYYNSADNRPYPIENVMFENGTYLKLDGTPHINDIGIADATDIVKIKTTVKIDGHEVTSETFGINAKYPLEGFELKSDQQIIEKDELINNQTVSVIGNVALEDKYNNKLVKDGEFVMRADNSNKTNASVWGITGLQYSKAKAVYANGKPCESVEVDVNGNLKITDPNISQDIEVTVYVKAVGYNYEKINGETVDGTFTVIVKATY